MTSWWYIGACVQWLIGFIGVVISMRASTPGSVQPAAKLACWVMAVAGLVALVMWIGALIKLGQIRAWGWFAAVLILHLIGLGIVGMVAYALAGPEEAGEVVYRPTAT